jgi:tryptophan 2,3-dioxygenase
MTDVPTGPAHAEGAVLDFSRLMSYGDYLGLDQILGAQHPQSGDHNELLFIIQHQTTELWFKLLIHELGAARERLRHDDLGPAFKMMARASRILTHLVAAWDVLATLTPNEYLAFRPHLQAGSGFQSYQHRMLEFLVGVKDRGHLEPHRHRADIVAVLEGLLVEPSLYDEAILLLARRGLPVDPAYGEQDWSVAHVDNDSVEAAWKVVYQAPEQYWDLYELGEELVDLEDSFRQFRFRHLTTVGRVIGMKRGTGGTSGIGYLRAVAETVMFGELWSVRTTL